MAASEDELARKQVQEAVWTWAGRAIALAAVFILGLAAGFWMWGYGPAGATHLREQSVLQEEKLRELGNKRVDIEGQLTVTKDRLDRCQSDLAKAREAARAAAAAPAP
jgi:hypothetical protein